MSPRRVLEKHRKPLLAGTVLLTVMAAPATSAMAAPGGGSRPQPYRHHLAVAEQRAAQGAQGRSFVAQTRDGDEIEDPEEIAEQAEQYAEARSAPGIVAPGAYTAAWQQLQSMP